MPWSRQGLGFPVNPTTGKHYRGGNVMALLACDEDLCRILNVLLG